MPGDRNSSRLCYDPPVTASPRVMNPDRPVNLPLSRLALAMPVTAVASILHRITGVVLFVGVFFLCYLLDRAVTDAAGFEHAATLLTTPLGQLGLWAILASLAYHVVAGLRHLLLDFHVGDSLRGGRVGAWIVIVVAGVAGVVLAAWLW